MDSPIAWPGGKRYLKKLLLQLIPEHKAYVEVFAGSAKLLFAKQPSRWEVVNDINEELINFYRVVKHRPAELAEMFDQECIHEARFAELKATAPATLTELERALRFAYLLWESFGAKGEHFAGMTANQIGKAAAPVKRSLAGIRDLLLRTSQRLASVLIERRSFEDCIRRYNSPGTFFYCDPPYTSFAGVGQYKPWPEEKHRQLFGTLSRIEGKFLLSYDDSRLIRDLCDAYGFHRRQVKVLYTLGAKSSKTKARELLISNYQLPKGA